jgi:hypothetical protein
VVAVALLIWIFDKIKAIKIEIRSSLSLEKQVLKIFSSKQAKCVI